MFKKNSVTTSRQKSDNQEEWQISVMEVLELDPWKFFAKPVPVYSQSSCLNQLLTIAPKSAKTLP
jgi:hypothetical protein